MKRQTLLKLIAAALAVLTFSTTVPAQPRINIEPEVLDFGIIPIGQSDELLLTIRNDGEAVLEIEDIAINDEAFTHDWEGEPEFNWEFRESDEFMDFLIIEAELDDEMLVEGDCIGGGVNLGTTISIRIENWLLAIFCRNLKYSKARIPLRLI